MTSDPLFGLMLHWLGGLAAGSFYVFYARVRGWAWEVYWLAGGFFAWVVGPWTLGGLLTEDLWGVLTRTPPRTLFLSWLFGALWGLGSLTAGLAIRYLGMGLGQGVTLGFCAAFGTLLPPMFKGEFSQIIGSTGGRVVLAGVFVSLVGIAISALAGIAKERQMTEAEKKATILEFSFVKGMLVASFAGIMSGFMSFGLDAGAPITELSKSAGTSAIWAGLPKVVVVLAGGFTTNLIACAIIGARNRSSRQFTGASTKAGQRAPLGLNYLVCACAGLTWYLQYFFYTMGESKMGAFSFSSWTLHMASIIVFSTIWGYALHEWRGASRRTHALLIVGLAVLVLSTVIVGWGNHLGTATGVH